MGSERGALSSRSTAKYLLLYYTQMLKPSENCSGEIWTNWVELAGDGSGWNPLDAASALLALLVSYVFFFSFSRFLLSVSVQFLRLVWVLLFSFRQY